MKATRKGRIKIGMGQMLVEGGEPVRNLGRAKEMVEKASKLKCDFVLLPEVLDLGWTHPSAKNEAEPIPGNRSDLLCSWAKQNKINICCGLTEKLNDKVFNTALLIDSDGNIIQKYHKINLLVVEQEYYTVGQHLSVIDTQFGTIGVNVCADNYHDSLEIGHTLARMGAQIILSPSAWTIDYHQTDTDNPYREKWYKPFHTLAGLYNLVIVSTTSVGYIVGGPYEGKKMVGCSLAVGKKGVIANGPYNEFAGELVTCEFDVPVRKEKGTEIGLMLQKKGFYK